MKFDFTKGKPARYLVSIHRETVDDHCYFHYYREAKICFDRSKATESKGVAISIYDLLTDIRKDYARV